VSPSPLLTILCAAVVIFAVLLIRGTKRQVRQRPSDTGKGKTIAIAALAAINIAAILGLAWFAATILFYDGLMIIELLICAGLIAVLGTATIAAFTLRRRSRFWLALTVLATTALPTIAVYGFLLYLDHHPIDMR
jgi:cytochrome bd-type quinol oxidase subunit 2